MTDDRKMQYLTQQRVHLPTPSRTTNSVNKSSETTSKSPAFQFISQDELLSLFEQRKGSQYLIPEGFEPVLIPRGSPLQPVANLLQNGKNLLLKHQQQLKIQNQNAAAPDVVVVNKKASSIISNININHQSNNSSPSDVRFPHLVLARSAAPTPPRGSVAKAQKPKKPPRPPNAFILYRRSKQPDIVAKNEGISNNEVSKQVGEMWHKEPLEEKLKFQQMAEAAKLEHMKKYPEYKYRPRRPHEKRRRTKRPSLTNNNTNVPSTTATTTTTTTTNNNNDNVGIPINNECGGLDTSPLMTSLNSISANNDFSYLQQPDRRSSIDTVSTADIDYFDESRRSSMVSCGDIEYYDYDHDQIALYDDVPSLVEEPTLQSVLQFTTSSCCNASNSPHDYNNVCVENAGFDLVMEGISPGNDSEVNPYEFFNNNFGYSEYFNNGTFDLSLMSSPNDQMMSCDNIDA